MSACAYIACSAIRKRLTSNKNASCYFAADTHAPPMEISNGADCWMLIYTLVLHINIDFHVSEPHFPLSLSLDQSLAPSRYLSFFLWALYLITDVSAHRQNVNHYSVARDVSCFDLIIISRWHLAWAPEQFHSNSSINCNSIESNSQNRKARAHTQKQISCWAVKKATASFAWTELKSDTYILVCVG